MTSRREFLSASAAAGFSLAGESCSKAIVDERPNIFLAISDDQSFAHTSLAGDPVVKTPVFDRVAHNGVYFPNADCCCPSCTPARSAALSGQHMWRLGAAGNLCNFMPKDMRLYTDILGEAGYEIGRIRKGWGPGNFEVAGRSEKPAGPDSQSFDRFLADLPEGKPFCFWFGTSDPHRPFEKRSGAAAGLSSDDVEVPGFLPDIPEVRNDILDYLLEIQRFDREVGEALALLEKAGKLENTLVVVTSDNGMAFPGAKTNLYDYGVRVPLVVQWPARVAAGRVVEDFVSFADFAPTFLEACGIEPEPQMSGRSLLQTLTSEASGRVDPERGATVVGRERHMQARPGDVGYPMRAIRTSDYLYIRNYEPDRWPGGDPPHYSDVDLSPTMEYMIEHRGDPAIEPSFERCAGKRPAEELYAVREDPYQLRNLADLPEYGQIKQELAAELQRRLAETGDSRALGQEPPWDEYPYACGLKIRDGPNGRGIEGRPL